MKRGDIHLFFLAAPNDDKAEIELTYNWGWRRNWEKVQEIFGHLAYRVDNIYENLQKINGYGFILSIDLHEDGHMAFVRSPDKISIEILQEGKPRA